MLFLAILGLVLAAVAWNIDSKINDCPDKDLHNANRMCMVLGTVMATSAIAFLVARRKDSPLPALQSNIYMGVIILLGIVVITLGSIMRSKAGTCDIKGDSNLLIVLGVFGIISPLVYYAIPMAKERFKNKSAMCGCNKR